MQGDNAFSQLSDVLSRFLHAEAEEAKEALDSNGSKNGVPEPREGCHQKGNSRRR